MKNKKKGFTLAELLIVVAIIAVLVAISIPIFTKQIQKARLATNQANARAAYAAAEAEHLMGKHLGGTETFYYYDTATGKVTVAAHDNSYKGVGGEYTTPSSWTTKTLVNGVANNALSKHVYKKWELVINNESGAVRQYNVHD